MLRRKGDRELYFYGSKIVKSWKNKDSQPNEVLSEEIHASIKPVLEAMF